MTRSVIDPITRIEGHLRVEMEVTNGKVSDAWVSGGCFRGMEMVVENRTPEDAAQIVQRICGVCPVSHAHSSAIAAEKAYGIKISASCPSSPATGSTRRTARLTSCRPSSTSSARLTTLRR